MFGTLIKYHIRIYRLGGGYMIDTLHLNKHLNKQPILTQNSICQIESELKKGKTIQLNYVKNSNQLKIGIINYHKINLENTK